MKCPICKKEIEPVKEGFKTVYDCPCGKYIKVQEKR